MDDDRQRAEQQRPAAEASVKAAVEEAARRQEPEASAAARKTATTRKPRLRKVGLQIWLSPQSVFGGDDWCYSAHQKGRDVGAVVAAYRWEAEGHGTADTPGARARSARDVQISNVAKGRGSDCPNNAHAFRRATEDSSFVFVVRVLRRCWLLAHKSVGGCLAPRLS